MKAKRDGAMLDLTEDMVGLAKVVSVVDQRPGTGDGRLETGARVEGVEGLADAVRLGWRGVREVWGEGVVRRAVG